MALAYTAPTWEDGEGTGISANQLQAISNCIEGLVQGTDKAIHSFTINGSVITVTFADGTVETSEAIGFKGIVSIEKTSTSGLVDTYTITYTDGTTTTFTVTNGGQSGMYAEDYDPEEAVKDAGGIPDYVAEEISGKADTTDLDGWSATSTVQSDNTVTFTGLDDSYGYDLYCSDKLLGISSMSKTGSGTSVSITYTVTGAASGDVCKLRILK